jgi:hypothetical protein
MDRIRTEIAGDDLALRAIYVVESEALKKRIKSEFDLSL